MDFQQMIRVTIPHSFFFLFSVYLLSHIAMTWHYNVTSMAVTITLSIQRHNEQERERKRDTGIHIKLK